MEEQKGGGRGERGGGKWEWDKVKFQRNLTESNIYIYLFIYILYMFLFIYFIIFFIIFNI